MLPNSRNLLRNAVTRNLPEGGRTDSGSQPRKKPPQVKVTRQRAVSEKSPRRASGRGR